MEAISSMAHTAAKAVWGDGTEHDEPASGVQGDVSKGEPYDGGNIGKWPSPHLFENQRTVFNRTRLPKTQKSRGETQSSPRKKMRP